MWASTRRRVAWAVALGAALAASPGAAKEGRPRKAAESRRAAPPAPERSPSSADTLSLDLGGISLELVRVPAGTFRQGSAAAERGRNGDETARTVSLSEDYYLGQYEVTVAQFTTFVNATGYRTEAERGSSGGFGWAGGALTQEKRFNWRAPGYPQSPRHPVGLVTFADAQAFTRWLSERTGHVVDLPTEAQWEHAYRAGTNTRFYSGTADATASTIGWFQGNAPEGTHAVGELKPNALGLFDMAGNVYEWCRDWYGPYEPRERATDPLQDAAPAGEKPRRVLRGGSFLRAAKDLRAAARYRNDPGSRNADNGFRVVASLAVTPGWSPGARHEAVPATKPVASSTAEATTEFSASTNSLLRLFILGGAGVFAASILFGLVKGLRRPTSSRRVGGGRAPAGVTVRPGRDGFWVTAPERLRGHSLHYRISGSSGVARSSVELEPNPNGQFVYTGYRPESVSVEQVLAVGAGVAAGVALTAAERRQQEEDDQARGIEAAPAALRRPYPRAYY